MKSYRVHVHDHLDQGRWLASADFIGRPDRERIEATMPVLSQGGRYEVRVCLVQGDTEMVAGNWLQGEPATGKRQPVNPELFARTAPKWNCVDYPGEGMHYLTPGGCAWCSMTREQIRAEQSKPAPGTVYVKRDGAVQETFAGPDPVQNSNDAFAWLLRHQGMSTDWAIRYEGWEITDPAPAPAHAGPCGNCGCAS